MTDAEIASEESAASRAREAIAHLASGMMSRISPWWRFRLWSRLVGPTAYATYQRSQEISRPVWPHNMTMRLNVGDWMERYAHRSGRYYQDDLIATLIRLVRPGETFVDIGANLGFVTLTAAHLVGPRGRVVAIEANAALVERQRKAIALNGLQNVEIHNLALGATNGEVSLVSDGHHGTAHIDLAPGGQDRVPLRRGDELLSDLPGPIFVKIDVEGAEKMVLQGLERLVARRDVRWLIEISEENLQPFGASDQDVFDIMTRAGYVAHSCDLSPFSNRVLLKRMDGPVKRVCYDVLFRREG